MMRNRGEYLPVSEPAGRSGRGGFPQIVIEGALAAAACVAMVGAVAYWGFGGELGLGFNILTALTGAAAGVAFNRLQHHRDQS